MDQQVVQATTRDTHGSTLTKLRLQGEIPGVVYGNGQASTPISVPEKAFTGEGGVRRSFVELVVDGKKVNAMVHDIQRHPVSKKVLHIDFYEVRMDQPIDSKVSVNIQGIEAVERRRGIVQQQLREVEVHALPSATPEYLNVDVSGLDIGDHLSAVDISLPAGVTLRSEPSEVVVTVLAAKHTGDTTTEETAGEENAEA